MRAENSGFIAIVDESGEFLFLQDSLQTPFSPIPVIGFDDSKQFMMTVRRRQKENPYNWIIVIADSCALSPSIDDGVFCSLIDEFSNFSGVAYTASPQTPEWQELINERKVIASQEHIVPRADPSSVAVLLKIIREIINKFSGYADITISGSNKNVSEIKVEALEAKSVSVENGRSDSKEIENKRSSTKKGFSIFEEPAMDGRLERSEQKDLPDSHKEQRGIDRPQTAVKLEDLVRPKTYLYRLLNKDNLNFLERLLLKEVAWDLFTRLKHDDLERLKKYQDFIKSDACPKKKRGWQIIGQALKYFPISSNKVT